MKCCHIRIVINRIEVMTTTIRIEVMTTHLTAPAQESKSS